MGFEKLHKMRLAVIGERCHIIDCDMVGIMLLYIFQDGLHLFQRLCLRGRRSLFFLPVGDEEEKE